MNEQDMVYQSKAKKPMSGKAVFIWVILGLYGFIGLVGFIVAQVITRVC